MDNKKIIIAAAVFLGLLGVTFAMTSKQDEQLTATESNDDPTIPTLEREAIASLEITRPGEDGAEATTVRLEKRGDLWWVTSPVEAEADQNAVGTALDKLEQLEVNGTAATRAANHERLEVDAAHGVRVVVGGSDGAIADLWIGAYRGQNTMVRLEGEERVATVSGSIKYAFNKELKDWRNRRVVDEAPDRVIAVEFASDAGTFAFHRGEDNEWAQNETVEGPEGPVPFEAIERFGSNKVQSLISSIARMRATNFAAEGIDASAAGFGAPTGVVKLTVRPDGRALRHHP